MEKNQMYQRSLYFKQHLLESFQEVKQADSQ